MNFLCLTEHLKYATGIAERFSGKNAALPILGSILLEQDNHILKITATNLEYAIQLEVPGSGSQTERIAVPAKIFSSLMQSFADEKVQLEGKNGHLHIKTEMRNSRINGLSPDEFPLIPKVEKTYAISMPAIALRAGIEHVAPAVSTSEFRPELGGVYIRVAPLAIHFAATDTFRLAEKTAPLDTKYEGDPFSFILPYRIAQEIARIADVDGEDVEITVGENQMHLAMGRIRIMSRTIDGAFPEYYAIIPRQFETSCFVKKDGLLAGIRASSIFASKLQDVSLVIGEKTMHINTENESVGEYKSILACATTGKEVGVNFNYRYLFDGLQQIDEDELFMGLNGGNGPCLLRNKEDSSFLYVLMPIRLS